MQHGQLSDSTTADTPVSSFIESALQSVLIAELYCNVRIIESESSLSVGYDESVTEGPLLFTISNLISAAVRFCLDYSSIIQ